VFDGKVPSRRGFGDSTRQFLMKERFMTTGLPSDGSASPEQQASASRWWTETASKCGVDLSSFDASAVLAVRLAWAAAAGLAIGTVCTRFSTKFQDSTEDQIRACVDWAAKNQIFIPPEFLCVDEAVKGRKQNRPGLNRARGILKNRHATVIVMFKLSRMFRIAHQANRFLQEEIYEQGLRGISVTQGIDTAKKDWRLHAGVIGIMDEEMLYAVADHVRAGQIGMFLKGWTVGAIGIGYTPVEVPGASRTKRGLPRTMPSVHRDHGAMVRLHFELVGDGMPLVDGVRKWRADGGPVDPRAKPGPISEEAYRRMLSRIEYTGLWKFGRKRNKWLSSADTLCQEVAPAEEVVTRQCEELRIVSDELFWKVQAILEENKHGPRPKRTKVHSVADLVVGVFSCGICGEKFKRAGGTCVHMHCPHIDCPARAMVVREDAVAAICTVLAKAMISEPVLVDTVMGSFSVLTDTSSVDDMITSSERRLQQLLNKIRDLEELVGEGSDEDRDRRKAQIVAAQNERQRVQTNIAALNRQRSGGREKPLTRSDVVGQIDDLHRLLDDTASGKLGADVVGVAATLFRRLVGRRVIIHAERRPGRARFTVKATFTPNIAATCVEKLGAMTPLVAGPVEQPITVTIKKVPRVDEIADEVQTLYDVDKKSFTAINTMLEAKYGEKIGPGNCCAAYRRYYEIRNLPLPAPRGKVGRPRKHR
jgi:DNA invertase Pin-like site-specific DNA recombinase